MWPSSILCLLTLPRLSSRLIRVLCISLPQVWGDAFLCELKDYLETVCAERTVPDAEFFLNKRDHPMLSKTLQEPYGFLAPGPLTREVHPKYAPIMSFYVSDEFADLRFPCQVGSPIALPPSGRLSRYPRVLWRVQVDWQVATGRVYPRSCVDHYTPSKSKAFDEVGLVAYSLAPCHSPQVDACIRQSSR